MTGSLGYGGFSGGLPITLADTGNAGGTLADPGTDWGSSNGGGFNWGSLLGGVLGAGTALAGNALASPQTTTTQTGSNTINYTPASTGAQGLGYQTAQDIYGLAGGAPNSNLQEAYQLASELPGMTQGDLDSAAHYYNAATQTNPADAANGYLSAGAHTNVLGAAQPYINQADTTAPQAIMGYMSPYTQSVVNAIGQAGQQNLRESILPQVQSTFTGAGQISGTPEASYLEEAIQRNNQTTQNAQAQALESGYSTAGNLYESDAQRALGAGQLAGQLTQDQAQNLLQAGSTYGNLENAYNNTLLGAGQGMQSLAGSQEGTYLNNINALQSTGEYQQQYPLTVLNAANNAANAVRPLQTGSSSNTTNVSTPPSPNPVSTGIGGALAGSSGLISAGINGILGLFADGGPVGYAAGGKIKRPQPEILPNGPVRPGGGALALPMPPMHAGRLPPATALARR